FDNGPDLFHVSDAHLRALEDKGKLDSLRDYQPTKLNPDLDSYPSVFEMFEINGKLKAVPFAFSPIIFVRNERIWTEAGLSSNKMLSNWDDLLDSALLCTKRDENGYIEQYGFCFTSGAHRWQVFVLQNDGQFF